MKHTELREAYLSFFEGKDHTRCPSDSLVPANDPTLLFTGSGMNQFKDMFLGVGNLPFKRATTAQKCFRAGDLDNVGRTYYHQTFFEMLGNFSFGDYWKREAILWGWEFITDVMKLPPKKIWVSVYTDDDEAYAIWRDEVGIPEKRIWRLGPKDNFWPADAPASGPNGPCGPCTEIFYDYGSPGKEGDPEAGRYCEFWNLVFQQYNRVGKNDLEALEQTGIDTGMGFERALAILNGVHSNFDTDLFLPIITAIARISGHTYAYDHPHGQQFRRIAEHARAATFLIADGVKPSNEERGYVVRKILRRAVRDGITLGIEKPFLHKLVPVVVEIMGGAYPELKSGASAASAFLKAEDEKFRETYHTGMQLLEREIARLEKKVLPGEIAFVLYDTHGFPLELCEEICAENGLTVDRKAFERSMESQRKRSREGSAMGGEVFQATAITAIKKDVATTEFLGYEHERAGATLRFHHEEGGRHALIFDRTPFYAESGGQIGDTGRIEGDGWSFVVEDTQKIEDYFLHWGRLDKGGSPKGKAELIVDAGRRARIKRNHSATHLLHAALRTILGKHVTQAGSLVAPDRLRFDFTHPQVVKPDELDAIEEWVNHEILENSPVTDEKMPYEKATAAGAMALFGEKYPPIVRVVTIGDHSMELCGGSHVGYSAEIGAGFATHESSVAAGVRRIEMITGWDSLRWAREQDLTVRTLAEMLKTSPEGLGARIEALQQEVRDFKRAENRQRKARGLESVEILLAGARDADGINVIVGAVEGDDAAALRSIADELKRKTGECAVLLAGRGSQGVSLVAAATDGAIAAGLKAGSMVRDLAQRLGGKGGGRPQMAQGRAPATPDLETALKEARQDLLDGLSSR